MARTVSRSSANVKRVADHPGFDMKTMLAHRATADVSLLQLETPKANPSAIGVPSAPLAAGNRFTIAGIGVTVRGNGKSAGMVRIGRSGRNRPARHLADPPVRSRQQGGSARARRLHRRFRRPGVRAATGQAGLVGVVDWSTGPNGSDGCGGLTGVTPLTLYRDWIVQTAKQWGSVLAAP